METKQIIEDFIDEAIKNQDNLLIDMLSIFAYSIPRFSGYFGGSIKDKDDRKRLFQEWLIRVFDRNITQKYGKNANLEEKLKEFMNFWDSSDLLKVAEEYDEKVDLFKELLNNKTSEILFQNVEKRINALEEVDKEVISFSLNYSPQLAPNQMDANRINLDTYDMEKWTEMFNKLFNRNLKSNRFELKNPKKWKSSDIYLSSSEMKKEYVFWEIGDILVANDLGYWTFQISGDINVSINLVIPRIFFAPMRVMRIANNLPKIKSGVN